MATHSTHRLILLILFLATMPALMGGCGQSSSSRQSKDGSPSLRGEILVGTQCPLGTISEPTPGNFSLVDCRSELRELQLTAPPGPIFLSGDCAEKTIGVRTTDGTVDTLWQVLPDGSFSLLIAGFAGELADDGAGHRSCLAGMTLELDGKMNCEQRDVFSIDISSMRFWMSSPASDQLAGRAACSLPPSCRMEGSLQLRQCG